MLGSLLPDRRLRRSVASRLAGLRMAGLLLWGALLLVPGAAVAGPQLVFEVRSGAVLHAAQPHDLWYPASLTKLMTTYLAFEAVEQGRIRPDTPLTASKLATQQPPSKIGIPEGGTISLEHALHLLLVRSSNDIAIVLAENLAGSVPAFVAEMNAAAARLGMTRTRFENPHGLPASDQVTTAHDMGLLARALLTEHPQHAGLFRTSTLLVGGKPLRSYNLLLGRYAGADGMKTGFICASGFNLVASATRNGTTLVAVLMGETSADNRTANAATLLDLAFEALESGQTGKTLAEMRPGPDANTAPMNMRPVVCEGSVPPTVVAAPESLGPFVESVPPVAIVIERPRRTVPLPPRRPDELAAAVIVPESVSLPAQNPGQKVPAVEASAGAPLPPPRPQSATAPQ